jgi:hypothetical protein
VLTLEKGFPVKLTQTRIDTVALLNQIASVIRPCKRFQLAKRIDIGRHLVEGTQDTSQLRGALRHTFGVIWVAPQVGVVKFGFKFVELRTFRIQVKDTPGVEPSGLEIRAW